MEKVGGEFIWIFGPSAAGKKTLIDRLLGGGEGALRRRLRIEAHVLLCEESIAWIGSHISAQTRRALVGAASSLLMPQTSVLIKGQTVDFENRTPQELRDAVPDATHRLLFLWASPDELWRRWQDPSPPYLYASPLEALVGDVAGRAAADLTVGHLPVPVPLDRCDTACGHCAAATAQNPMANGTVPGLGWRPMADRTRIKRVRQRLARRPRGAAAAESAGRRCGSRLCSSRSRVSRSPLSGGPGSSQARHQSRARHGHAVASPTTLRHNRQAALGRRRRLDRAGTPAVDRAGVHRRRRAPSDGRGACRVSTLTI